MKWRKNGGGRNRVGESGRRKLGEEKGGQWCAIKVISNSFRFKFRILIVSQSTAHTHTHTHTHTHVFTMDHTYF